MKKLLLVTIKYLPVIQMAGTLLNNTLYYLEVPYISFTIDFTLGNTLAIIFLLYLLSYVFGFCIWHRLIITGNLINTLIAATDSLYTLPVKDIELLISYYIVCAITIIIGTIIHIKNVKRKIKNNKRSS